jgi:hypothetical protein
VRRLIGLAAALTLLAATAEANDGHHHHHHHDGAYWDGHDDFFGGPEEVYVYQFGSGADHSLSDGLADDRKNGTGIGQSLEVPTGATGICPVISGNGKCSGGAWGTY